jgi:hypothetical protein
MGLSSHATRSTPGRPLPPTPRFPRPPYALVFLALGAALPSTAAGQTGPEPPLVAHRLAAGEDVRLDGRLDEPFWSNATPVDDFTQVDPVEGGAPSERTEIRVVYDQDALYIGAKLYDDPAGILAYQRRRDAGLGTDDRFMWILDTFRDGRTGYFFEINAAGLMGDGLMGSGGFFGVNKSWDGIWEARVAVLDDGWSAEIRIPFSTLNFNPEATSWGINFQRTIRRRNEEIRWRGWRRNQGLTSPVHAGELVGIRNVSQGLGLEVVPYAVQNWRTVLADDDPTSFPGDVGMDLGYSITPSLRAALSVNTDFAEVEVDQRRVNLTRFPLRFPEQRDFFLEGSGVFSFAPRSGPEPYFSRRIGLQAGTPVPIRYGARLGGQAGRYELGFIQVATGSLAAIEPEAFTVARVKRTLFEQSAIGAVYTRRATEPGPDGIAPEDRHTLGVDLDFSTRNFMGDNNFDLEAFLAWNSNPDPSADPSLGDLTARGFRASLPNDVWQTHLSYREFGAGYAPAVGFVSRNDFRRVEPRLAWRPRPASIPWIRQLQFSTQFRYLESMGTGVVEERLWDFGLLGVEFESGDNLELKATRTYEFLDEEFTLAEEIPILPGGYTTWEVTLQGRTAGRRPVSFNGELSRGGFWDGTRRRYQAGLTVRPRPGLSLSGNYELNQLSLPRGEFDTNLVRLNGGWDLSPWASVTTSLQYDDVSDIVGLFALMRWIVQPGNEIYLVYTHNWQRLDQDPLDREFVTLSRGGAVKATYTLRW